MSGYFRYCVPHFAKDDLAMLERVLLRHCTQEEIRMTSFDASDAAVALTELFRRGITSEMQLGKILRPRVDHVESLSPSAGMDASATFVIAPLTHAVEHIALPESRRDAKMQNQMSVTCNRCDVPVQVDKRNDEKSRVHCPVCGADFGTWGEVSKKMLVKQNGAFRDRDSWRTIQR